MRTQSLNFISGQEPPVDTALTCCHRHGSEVIPGPARNRRVVERATNLERRRGSQVPAVVLLGEARTGQASKCYHGMLGMASSQVQPDTGDKWWGKGRVKVPIISCCCKKQQEKNTGPSVTSDAGTRPPHGQGPTPFRDTWWCFVPYHTIMLCTGSCSNAPTVLW